MNKIDILNKCHGTASHGPVLVSIDLIDSTLQHHHPYPSPASTSLRSTIEIEIITVSHVFSTTELLHVECSRRIVLVARTFEHLNNTSL